MPRTAAFLAHNAIPVQFTEEDFDQVLSGNFVTKVIYLPDPEFQELALAGVETLVSTRLDPGVDPIVEADRRGAILAIVRLGNKDLEMPGEAADVGGVMPASYGCLRARDGPTTPWPAAAPCRRTTSPGVTGPAVRHADVRHADRAARPAARSAWSSRRPAEARDREPHARPYAQADAEGARST